MKMPAAYAAGISLRASSGEGVRREPGPRGVAALRARGAGDTARGFSLCDQRVDRRVVVAAPVGTWEAERAVEEVGEDGSSVGRPEPVRNPPGLGDVPLARL